MIHETAIVDVGAIVGENTKIWHWTHVRESAVIGRDCTIGQGVYVDAGVVIGERVKIQNGVSVYQGVVIEDDVFVGPNVTFTNDLAPRSSGDWTITPTLVRYGAAIGAGATIVCGVTIGEWAMVGAGSVVTSDIPNHGLVRGNPARVVGYVCERGHTMDKPSPYTYYCGRCGKWLVSSAWTWEGA